MTIVIYRSESETMKTYIKESTKKFLAYVTLNPTASVDEIAKALGFTAHTIQNKFWSAKQKGLLPKSVLDARARGKAPAKPAVAKPKRVNAAKPDALAKANQIIAEQRAIIKYLEGRLNGTSV